MRAWLRQGKGETRVLEATSAPLNSTLFFHMDDHNEYHVETSQVLGTGSFSWVYACTHAGSGERFACKAIDISNKQRHGNFIRERQALDRMLRHRDRFGDQFYPSALIRMFSSLETLPRTGLLVVERLPTMTLHTYLERLEVNQMTLGADLVCHYADQLTEALSFMHRAGVTHLDIKTENIALDESRRQVILFDFGFAHCYNPGDTGEGLRINETHCSPMYMPPEILSARNKEEFYDPRLVDIWCLGHVFFELMTNHVLLFTHTYPPQNPGYGCLCVGEVSPLFLRATSINLFILPDVFSRPSSLTRENSPTWSTC
jgi:serine/threonine protein kinase